MRISDALVEKLLVGADKLTNEQLAGLEEKKEAEKKPLQDLVIREKLISEADLTKLYAEEIDLPFVALNPKEIKREVLKAGTRTNCSPVQRSVVWC